MAFVFTGRFEPEIEERMRGFYQTLNEKDARRFAALEARQLGYGGVTYIAEGLGCAMRTIERAASERDRLPEERAAGRVRAAGGGRRQS